MGWEDKYSNVSPAGSDWEKNYQSVQDDLTINPLPAVSHISPDNAGKALQINKTKGIDAILAAENLPQLQNELDQDKWNKFQQKAPTSAKVMTQQPALAAAAKDQLKQVADVEETLGQWARRKIPTLLSGIPGIGPIAEAADWVGTIGRMNEKKPLAEIALNHLKYDPVNAWLQVKSGYAGAAAHAAEGVSLMGENAQRFAGVMPVQVNPLAPLFSIIPNEVMRNAAGKFSDYMYGKFSQSNNDLNFLNKEILKPASSEENASYSGASSGLSQLMTLPLGMASPELSLMSMATQTAGQTFGQDKTTTDLPYFARSVHGSMQGAIEYLTEIAPTKTLFKELGNGQTVLDTAVKFLQEEIPGEMVATATQNFMDWAFTNPDKSIKSFWDNYASQLPKDEYETIIGTLVGGAIQAGGMKGIDRVINGPDEQRRAKYEEAQLAMQQMQKLQETIRAADVLARRSPETFSQLVQTQAEESGTAPTHVYINANLLNQAAQANGVTLEQLLPGQAEQVALATAANADVEIPIGDWASQIAINPIGDQLLEHIKLDDDPNTKSDYEARLEAENHIQQFRDDVNNLMKQKDAEDVFVQGAQKVEEDIYNQIMETGVHQLDRSAPPRQYRPDEARIMALFQRDMYVSLASRMKTTPDKVYKMLKNTIVGQGQAALNQNEQQIHTPEFKNWFGDSKVVDSEGNPLVVYHGSPDARFMNDDATFRNRWTGDTKGAHWFTPSRSTAATYADDRRAFDYQNAEPDVIPVYLNLRNPLVIDADGANWRDAQKRGKTSDVIQEAQANGHDGVIIRNVKDDYNNGKSTKPTDTYVVFDSTQIKHATKNNGQFDPNNPNILNQSAKQFIADQTSTPEFKQWSNDAPFIDSETAKTHDFKTGEKVALESYHGTARADRVGTKFSKKRATSGPMAFFTSSPELASGYAQGKQDTSLAYEDGDYANWFKYKPKGARSFVNISRAWYSLPSEVKSEISKRMPDIRTTDEGEIIYEEGGGDIGAYEWNLKQTQTSWNRMGNPLQASVETWLTSGALFGEEQEFMKVLKLAGFPMKDVNYDSPKETFPFVYKTYIQMQNPLVTNDVPQYVVDALNNAAKRDRSRAQRGGADAWDKNTRTIKEWVAAFNETGDNSYVWTSIPDKVTQVFKDLGFDGIVDWSGKGGGHLVAPVYIPFEENQVKSAIGNKGKFSANADILKQETRGGFDPASLTTILTKQADLSTFLHESWHFYLEALTRLASVAETPQEIKDDLDLILQWQKVQGNTPAERLATWQTMTIDQQRPVHEALAYNGEIYLTTGNAPSVGLHGAFQRFSTWLKRVYKSIRDDLNAVYKQEFGKDLPFLTQEIRSVMDRALASEDQIRQAERMRGYMNIFQTQEEADLFDVVLSDYMKLDEQARQAAIDEQTKRGMRDIKWGENAKSRHLKQLQQQAAGLRKIARMQARSEIMSLPIYQAYSFLTGNVDKMAKKERKPVSKHVDPENDSLFIAISKLGGIDRQQLVSEWGVDPADIPKPMVFGKPLARATEGKTIDQMAETLAQYGYLELDENGKWDLHDFEERFFEELHGRPQLALLGADAKAMRDAERMYGSEEKQLYDISNMPAGRLDREEIKARYGDKAKSIDKMLRGDGIPADAVAEYFGFSSGDELVKALMDSKSPNEAIEARTQEIMLEKHGEMATQEQIEASAERAIHNDLRARHIATAWNAVAKAKGDPKVIAESAKNVAEQEIGKKKIRDVRVRPFTSAETKAANAAKAAMKKGDTNAAADALRNQLLSNRMAKAAIDAVDFVDSALKYLKKFDKASIRKVVDPDYVDQIEAILEKYELKRVSRTRLDKRVALASWLASKEKEGIVPEVPQYIIDEAQTRNYQELTVDEMRELVDTIKQIEHLGRTKSYLLTTQNRKRYEAVRDEMADSINENSGDRQAVTRTASTWAGKLAQSLKRFFASHIKAATYARVMDGGKSGGPVWEYLIRSANDRGDMETSMRAKATEDLTRILEPVFKLGKMGGKGIAFPSLKDENGKVISLNREQRLAVALNVGNAGNLQRLLGGNNWTQQQIQPVLNTLTKAEWEAIQNIWDYFETFRPMIGAKERRVYGKEPNWIDPVPFSINTADGGTIHLRGGYYPIKYDPMASQRAEEHSDAEAAKRQMQGAYSTATTRRSFTKQRAEEVQGRPLLLSLSGIYSGVNEIIHDLAWHEWLIDVNKLTKSQKIDEAIRTHYGPEVKSAIKNWINDIAEGDAGAAKGGEEALSRLRQGISAAGLGFNVISALQQPVGITQSWARIGSKYIGRGIKAYLSSPIDLAKEINEKSEFMRNRQRTRFRELNELRNKVQDQSKLKEGVDGSMYFLMMKFQQMVDVPTWQGAYEQAIASGNDEKRAVALADQAVIDSQGGGMTKDQSGVERNKNPAWRLFTVFYSFMNTALNLNYDIMMSRDNAGIKAAKLLAVDVVPVVLTYMLKALVVPGGDDDWDMEEISKRLLANEIDFLMGQFVVVRELSETFKTVMGANDLGRDYKGPAGLRMIVDMNDFAKQMAQGDFDDAFRKAMVNLVGDFAGLPAAQINRTWTGAQALADGKTSNPLTLLTGYQTQH